MSVLNYYKNWLAKWPKEAGPKPTIEEVESIHKLGARAGSKAALANAMYLRKDGATSEQVSQVLGGPHLNKLRSLLSKGVVERVPTPPTSEGHTVYKVKLNKSATASTKSKKRQGKKQPEAENTENKEQSATA